MESSQSNVSMESMEGTESRVKTVVPDFVIYNQMKIVQHLNLTSNANIVIEIPIQGPAKQWHLVGIGNKETANPSENESETSSLSYYDGFQIYNQFPYIKSFHKDWQASPDFVNARDDETFVKNLVYARDCKE